MSPTHPVVAGHIVRGLQQGRILGFPTINVCYAAENETHLSVGVYAARVTLNDGVYDGAAVVGGDFVESSTPKLEVYLLHDTKYERYGEPVRVALLEYVSALKKISDTDALRKKIAADVAAVEKYLRAVRENKRYVYRNYY